ncbi:unnamed protein product [Arctogadus glacialis]
MEEPPDQNLQNGETVKDDLMLSASGSTTLVGPDPSLGQMPRSDPRWGQTQGGVRPKVGSDHQVGRVWLGQILRPLYPSLSCPMAPLSPL